MGKNIYLLYVLEVLIVRMVGAINNVVLISYSVVLARKAFVSGLQV